MPQQRFSIDLLSIGAHAVRWLAGQVYHRGYRCLVVMYAITAPIVGAAKEKVYVHFGDGKSQQPYESLAEFDGQVHPSVIEYYKDKIGAIGADIGGPSASHWIVKTVEEICRVTFPSDPDFTLNLITRNLSASIYPEIHQQNQAIAEAACDFEENERIIWSLKVIWYFAGYLGTCSAALLISQFVEQRLNSRQRAPIAFSFGRKMCAVASVGLIGVFDFILFVLFSDKFTLSQAFLLGSAPPALISVSTCAHLFWQKRRQRVLEGAQAAPEIEMVRAVSP